MKRIFFILLILSSASLTVRGQQASTGTSWIGKTVKIRENGVKYIYKEYKSEPTGDPTAADPRVLALSERYARALQDSTLFSLKKNRNIEKDLVTRFKEERASLPSSASLDSPEAFDIRKVGWEKIPGGLGLSIGYTPSFGFSNLGKLTDYGGSLDLGLNVSFGRFYVNPVVTTGRYMMATNGNGFIGNARREGNLFTDFAENVIASAMAIFDGETGLNGKVDDAMYENGKETCFRGISIRCGWIFREKGNLAFSAFAGPEHKVILFSTPLYGGTQAYCPGGYEGWGGIAGVSADWRLHRKLHFSNQQPAALDSYLRASLFGDCIWDSRFHAPFPALNFSLSIGFQAHHIRPGK